MFTCDINPEQKSDKHIYAFIMYALWIKYIHYSHQGKKIIFKDDSINIEICTGLINILLT